MIASVEAIWTEEVQRKVYRSLLQATGFPGDVFNISDLLAGREAVMGVLATLLDGSVTWADPDGRVDESQRRMLAARSVDANEADFVLCDGTRPPAKSFQPSLGDLLNPERAATVILTGTRLGATHGCSIRLSGPGVPGERTLCVEGIDRKWFECHADWNQAFPLGVDVILTDRSCVAALPRTTKVQVVE